jgi:hypothetical protein
LDGLADRCGAEQQQRQCNKPVHSWPVFARTC